MAKSLGKFNQRDERKSKETRAMMISKGIKTNQKIPRYNRNRDKASRIENGIFAVVGVFAVVYCGEKT